MATELPNYLNENFFKAALEDGLHDESVDIKKIVLSDNNSGGGENYCSKIYRAKALYRSSKTQLDKELALIVKSIAITPATQFLEDFAVYLREKMFYFDVLGKLEMLIGDNTKFGAKCFYSTCEPMQTIVFDDLTQYGYRLASRQDGLNEEHCKITLEKLGKFHAASMHYIRTSERYIDFMTLQLRTLANLVATWGEDYKEITEKLHKHCDNITENLVRTGKAKLNEITVLNHGDLWVNNFMFKYDEHIQSKPIDVVFVDFQHSFFGSPGCDINFFLNSSVQLNVLMKCRDSLIESYYEAFRESLQRMHFEKIPSLEDIKMEITSRELYGFFASYSFLPMIAMQKEDSYDISLESLDSKEFAIKKVKLMFSSNPRTTDTLRYTLKRFNDLGILG
uniref:CHK domain-containing protein n=1 Tax=Glossina brevipalpis TaxID=37001 RepID=A0A1A9X258_9MUSC